MDGGEPDIPIYKVIECTGPTNTRVYKVAVYFRGKRLASSTGHSIQQAEMEAAKKALENSSELFPQLDYQKRVMAHSMKRQKGKSFDGDRKRGHSTDLQRSMRKEDDSNLPKQYRVRDVSKEKSPDESNSEPDSNAESSDSSHSECSSSKNKKIKHKIKHVHLTERRTKCTHHSVSETEGLFVEEMKCKSEPNLTNDATIKDVKDEKNEKDVNDEKAEKDEKENETNSSDTDVSLESGEIL